MTRQTETEPPNVPEMAIQGGDIKARWGWVEPSVWTERMLTTLERGVRGGHWYSLIDKVHGERNLSASWEKVRKKGGAAGVDRQSIEVFERNAEKYLKELEEELRSGKYEPKSVKRVWIPKPGSAERRPLGIPAVKDRIAQTALKHVLEPIYEHEFMENSYGFRPGRGCKDALRRVDELLKQGNVWVLDADIKSYFDNIDHEILLKDIAEQVTDGRILKLVEAYLKQPIMDDLLTWEPAKGSPQGAVISPLLANIYLHPVDRAMKEAGYEMVRYADDTVVLCQSKEEAEQALELMKRLIEGRKLALHPEKTKIVDAVNESGGFNFLGYRFEKRRRYPRDKSMKKFKDRARELTRRTNGKSLTDIITKLNMTLRGWFEYFKHSHKNTFKALDGWIRGRLRSILRKRRGGRGRGRGLDHHRWPNVFFWAQGLFTMTKAHAALVQSLKE